MNQPLVELDGVTCIYGSRPVVVDADLQIHRGDLIGIVGPSGAGKTTMLRVVLGSVIPTAGRCRRIPGLRTAYVPQVETVNWDFPVTVADVVLMGRARLLPWRSRAEHHEVAGVLERLGLGGLERRHIRELSGGQQQRVFIARALLGRPQLLALDEPTSGVDVRTRHEVLHLLGELNHDGLAIVLSTHDLNGIASHLPQLVFLNTQIVAAGSPRDVLTPQVLERTYGAPMDVLEHEGMRVVIDHQAHNVIPLRRAAPA